MAKKLNTAELYALYLEWLGRRAELTGREKRELACWVLKQRPELADAYSDEPALFQVQCRDIQSRPIQLPPKGLGAAVAKRNMSALFAKYMTLPTDARGAFMDFVNRVCGEYTTERALREYLGVRP